jgi:hypothetical protein
MVVALLPQAIAPPLVALISSKVAPSEPWRRARRASYRAFPGASIAYGSGITVVV